MGKYQANVHRKDSLDDHGHKLEDGTMTEGSLYKPNATREFPHSHLYCHDGKVYETGIANIGPGHTHDYSPEPGHEYKETSGPVAVSKRIGAEIPRTDSLEKQTTGWVVRSLSGHVISRGATRQDAMEGYDIEGRDGDAYDAAMLASGDVDEGKWNKAKKASVASAGKIKWPLVNYIYGQMGGS